jgi:hypothetical protein
MRQHKDAMAVGSLRAALKSNRLMLFAQPIVALRNRDLPGGYELLLRLRELDGSLAAPGPLIDAARRYQLLPSIDRWVGSQLPCDGQGSCRASQGAGNRNGRRIRGEPGDRRQGVAIGRGLRPGLRVRPA